MADQTSCYGEVDKTEKEREEKQKWSKDCSQLLPIFGPQARQMSELIRIAINGREPPLTCSPNTPGLSAITAKRIGHTVVDDISQCGLSTLRAVRDG